MASLRRDLEVAEAEKMHPAIIAELKDRIEAHLEYKRNYHKRNYVPRQRAEVPANG